MISVSYLYENIKNPFRSGTVSVSVGKTTYKGVTQAFIMIDDLDWFFRLKPSFVVLFPSEKALSSPGDKTNGLVVYAKTAMDMEFNISAKGEAKLSTYFFGEPKEGRTFDFFYRLMETGFILSDFQDMNDSIFRLKHDTEVSISSAGYEHPGIFDGKTKNPTCEVRVTRKG